MKTANGQDGYTKKTKGHQAWVMERCVCGVTGERRGGLAGYSGVLAESYMGRRGALGPSLRASWQWQHQCQTLEEERTPG